MSRPDSSPSATSPSTISSSPTARPCGACPAATRSTRRSAWRSGASVPQVVAPIGPDYPVAKLGDRIDLSRCRPIARNLAQLGPLRRGRDAALHLPLEHAELGGLQPERRRSGRGTVCLLPSRASAVGTPPRTRRGAARQGREPHLGRSRRPAAERGAARRDRPAARPRRPVHAEPPGRRGDVSREVRRSTRSRRFASWRRIHRSSSSSAARRARSRTSRGAPDYSRVPSAAEWAVDETGAGDAFCGGALVGFSRKLALGEALTRAAVSASFAVEAVGPAALVTASRGGRRAAALNGSARGSKRGRFEVDARNFDDQGREGGAVGRREEGHAAGDRDAAGLRPRQLSTMLEAMREVARGAPERSISARVS